MEMCGENTAIISGVLHVASECADDESETVFS